MCPNTGGVWTRRATLRATIEVKSAERSMAEAAGEASMEPECDEPRQNARVNAEARSSRTPPLLDVGRPVEGILSLRAPSALAEPTDSRAVEAPRPKDAHEDVMPGNRDEIRRAQ